MMRPAGEYNTHLRNRYVRLSMKRRKRLLLISGIILVVLVLIVIVTPLFVNANTFRPEIEQALSGMLNRKVTIGQLRVSVLQGSLVADRIAIGDDPAYSHGPFVTAKSLAVGVDLMPLIFSRELKVHSLTFDDPHVVLLRDARGNWNFDSLGGKAKSGPPAEKENASTIKSFTVDRLAVNNATIAFGRAGKASRLAYKNANLSASNISATRAFPLTFDARTPGKGKLNLKADVGPIVDVQANRLPFHGKLNVDNVPAEDVQNLLAVLGYALPTGSSLQGGTLKANLTLHGPFDRLVTSGPVQLTNVRLAGYSILSQLEGALGTTGSGAGNDTLIKVASSDLRYAPNGMRAEHLDIIVPALGTITGSGTVAANNRLNFRMVAKLAGSSPLAQIVNLPMLNQKNSDGLPFRVEGTTAHPKIIPSIQGVAGIVQRLVQPQGKQQQQQPGGVVGGILNNLLGNKKKKTAQKQQQP
jgi:hypothetical protein